MVCTHETKPAQLETQHGFQKTTRDDIHIMLSTALMTGLAKYTGTPLHIAVDKKSIAMAKLLLEHEARINETGEYGATPLHSAASEGQEEMISLLKEHGANISEKDRYGLTAWDWAKANGHSHVLDLLDVTKAEGDNKPSQRPSDEMKVFF